MTDDTTFRQWKPEAWFLARSQGEEGIQIAQELQCRKIDQRLDSDKLCWGYRPVGTFTLKEATSLASGATTLPTER